MADTKIMSNYEKCTQASRVVGLDESANVTIVLLISNGHVTRQTLRLFFLTA